MDKQLTTQYRFKIEFVSRKNGNCPSKDFYDSLDIKVKAKFIAIGKGINKSQDGILRDTDKHEKLKGKHAKYLWEMKVYYDKFWYRIFCFRDNSDWWWTHGFKKKGNSTPITEIAKANDIRKEYYDIKIKA